MRRNSAVKQSYRSRFGCRGGHQRGGSSARRVFIKLELIKLEFTNTHPEHVVSDLEPHQLRRVMYD
jgi:hypothetical protein